MFYYSWFYYCLIIPGFCKLYDCFIIPGFASFMVDLLFLVLQVIIAGFCKFYGFFWGGFVFGFVFFCVPQLYLWGSPLLGEIFAYVTVF